MQIHTHTLTYIHPTDCLSASHAQAKMPSFSLYPFDGLLNVKLNGGGGYWYTLCRDAGLLGVQTPHPPKTCPICIILNIKHVGSLLTGVLTYDHMHKRYYSHSQHSITGNAPQLCVLCWQETTGF
jgi:hypothetical protein